MSDPSAPLHPRAAELIRQLALQPHPEGGHYKEVFRSSALVQPADGRQARPGLTTIYFLLSRGEHSRWHRVRSDEAWHFYEGEPLELFWIEDQVVHRRLLSTSGDAAQPVAVVPAGCWQAARPLGSYTLVGCSVGPGFDFADFEMIAADSPDAGSIRAVPGVPDGLM